MRGFLYTVIVLVLALSFMYIITIQNSLQSMQSPDYSLLGIKQSYNALYGISAGENSISGKLGNAIRIDDYKAIMENYNAIRNSDIKIELTPDFECGDTQLGFSGFGGGGWNTELKHSTEFTAKSSGKAVTVNKNWQWAESGVLLKLKVSDADGSNVFDEQGYVNETLNNRIDITDENGDVFVITLQDSVLSIDGKGEFSETINSNCRIGNRGYVEKNGIKYKI